jgi:hypothetical protein
MVRLVHRLSMVLIWMFTVRQRNHSSGSVAGVIIGRKERGGDRLVRALLAALLAVVTVSTLRKGKRNTGLLALVGALGFGFNAATSFCGVNRTLGIDSTTDE